MSKSKSDKLEEAHNKGQEDAAEGEDYHPPNSETATFGAMISPFHDLDQVHAENSAYRDGWENGKKSKK